MPKWAIESSVKQKAGNRETNSLDVVITNTTCDSFYIVKIISHKRCHSFLLLLVSYHTRKSDYCLVVRSRNVGEISMVNLKTTVEGI